MRNEGLVLLSHGGAQVAGLLERGLWRGLEVDHGVRAVARSVQRVAAEVRDAGAGRRGFERAANFDAPPNRRARRARGAWRWGHLPAAGHGQHANGEHRGKESLVHRRLTITCADASDWKGMCDNRMRASYVLQDGERHP